jgi:hypothetical protein
LVIYFRPLGDVNYTKIEPEKHMGTVEIFPALRDEGDDLHPAPDFRADHRVRLIDLPDHGRPTFGRKAAELLLNDPEH